MITKKMWNSFSRGTRITILNKLGYDNTTRLYQDLCMMYKHDFNHDATGFELKKILNNLYKDIAGNIKIITIVKPVYNNNKTLKPKEIKEFTQEAPYGICCCCGKPLTREDKYYYDLDSYCIDCAISDGIRTSKD